MRPIIAHIPAPSAAQPCAAGQSASGHGRRPRGFTLAEALLASVVVTIAAASATLPLTAAAQNTVEAEKLRAAVALGQALMDEIVARPVVDSRVGAITVGPSGIETSRKSYLTVDAFHGFSESSQKTYDYSEKAITETSQTGLWRTSSVQYVTFAGQQAGDTTGFALVRVNVYSGTRLLYSLTRLVAKEG